MEFLFVYLNAMTAGLLAPLFLFACYYVRRSSIFCSKKTRAPKAGGAWPIIGHLPLLAGSKLLHITFGSLADRYGPIFTMQIGIHQAVVVSSGELAKELFTTNDMAVSERPNFTAFKYLGYDGVMFAFAPYGDYWREMRKIISLKLLSNHQIELLKHVRLSEIETLLKELYKLWTEKKNGSGHVLVDLNKWFGELGLNVILRMVVGKRCSGGGEAEHFRKTMREFFHYLGMFVLRDAIPFLGWLDAGGHEKGMKTTAKEMNCLVSELLEEHRRKRGSAGKVATKEQDFMDSMLSVLEEKDFAGYDSDMIIKSACLNLIAGGSDTSTVTLTWTISLLLNNKQALEKAQEELDRLVGRERQVNEFDISKLIYLQAIIKESLRLYPPAPLSAPRVTRENCTIGGCHIKKGTRLIINVWKIHRDPKNWPDPLQFKPERFLTSHKDIDVRGQNFELIPFGSGRRACPGTAFGLQMVHIALARFLQAFQISNPTTEPIDMTESPGLTNLKATPLEVLLSPRLPPGLY
ncbi:cytochrome P450 CYP82D47 [Jatropha curcas]|uniref:cytochrome P450 CYP82D47 n=1 Tax=Jatropha curcas TaxID=180498 RepID=UPI001893E7EB|nr:cytochrome P450 CYP82D47 [Jatropha curcas]